MAVFWVLAASMLGVALTCVLAPLLRRGPRAPEPSPEDLNVAVHRDRLARLEQERADAELDPGDYEQARAELERALLEELSPADPPPDAAANRRLARWSAAVLAVSLPALVVGLYWQLGTPAKIPDPSAPRGASAGAPPLPPVDEMVARLEQRLRSEPHDGEGWLTLARSYTALERFADAARAFARAHELIGDQPDLLVDYAQAEILSGGDRSNAKASELVSRALAIEPRHAKGLWIAGFAAHQRGEREEALRLWGTLAQQLAEGSREREIVDRLIAEVSDESDAVRGVPATPSADVDSSGLNVTVQVSIAAEMAAKARPTDTVFVFARVVDGPPMPVALATLKVSDLPSAIVLDDSMSMLPSAKLSDQKQVVIGARVSRSGNALPQPGDLQGMSGVVDLAPEAAPVELVISQEIE